MDSPRIGRRIAVVGTSGSGKSFVARALADRLGVRYISNDAIIWGPNWTPSPPETRLERFRAAMAGDSWTFDGNFASLRDPEDRLTLARIDTLVWIDLPRAAVHWQLLKRTVRRSWTKEPLWHGNRESWRLSFLSRDSVLWWSIKTYALRRRQWSAVFANPALAHLIRLRLTSRREVDQFIASIPAAESGRN
ncbi:MAG: (d)CMP kinase [Planctomycetota bacterium]|nr:(d)CMP kinase [Planctomycetota bacterium]